MKMYALKNVESSCNGNCCLETRYVRRSRSGAGSSTRTTLVDKLEEATFWKKRSTPSLVLKHSKIPLTLITIEVIAKEIEE